LISCREGISLQGAESFAFWKNTKPFFISHSVCSCIQATDYEDFFYFLFFIFLFNFGGERLEEYKMKGKNVYLIGGRGVFPLWWIHN
jgi:hypothetical protein